MPDPSPDAPPQDPDVWVRRIKAATPLLTPVVTAVVAGLGWYFTHAKVAEIGPKVDAVHAVQAENRRDIVETKQVVEADVKPAAARAAAKADQAAAAVQKLADQ